MPEVLLGGRRFFFDSQREGEPRFFPSGLGGDHRAFGVSGRHLSATYRALALDSREAGRSDRAAGLRLPGLGPALG